MERYADWLELRDHGGTLAFTSTSKDGFLPAYGDRIGIALMKLIIPAGTPVLDFQRVLPRYAKAEEREVLLPPCLALSFEMVPLTDRERLITDAEGDPPVLSCVCRAEGLRRGEERAEPLPEGGSRAAARVCEALNRGEEPPAETVERYLKWKKAFRSRVLEGFCK